MLLDSVCRLLLKVLQARGVTPGLVMAYAEGSSAAAMASLLSGLTGGLPACNRPCAGGYRRGWSSRTALVPQPPTVGQGDQRRRTWLGVGGGNGGEKEEDGVSLPTLTVIFLSAEDVFLQPSQMTSSFS